MKDTDKLKRLAEAATQGPWEVPAFSRSGVHQPDLQCWIPSGEDDAAFIAAANPQTILALIAENERLKAQAEFEKHAAQDERERLNRTVVAKLKIAAAALRDTKYMLACIGHDMPHIDKALAVVDA